MNSGILLVAELPGHREGGHAENIVIEGNLFEDCGFFPRYGAIGGIGVKSAGFEAPLNKRLAICNNTFKDLKVGIDLHDAEDVWISGNRYEGVIENVAIEAKSTKDIVVRD